VKEGDRVRKGQVVARIESIQASADLKAQQASLASTEADSAATEAGMKVQDDTIRTQQATIDRTKANLELSRINFERAEQMYKSKLSSQQDYDQRKADYESQKAGLQEAELRLQQLQSQRAQMAAQVTSAQRRIAQVQAGLTRVADVLAKFDVVAPIDGIVTNLPVRVGETVVPGVQNSAASAVMTIADMSLITAEVKVDETDIVNVALGQPADVTIDAIPNKTFKGHVTEIGNTAILRSTGLAASQSAISSQEAKDFKVVIAINNPSAELRPGLSCTAKVTTATRKNAVTIPIQSLTVRQKGDLEPEPKNGKQAVQAATKLDPVAEKAKKEEIQGVFVVKGEKAEYRKVETGITGATDIEVLSGLKDGEEIITGSYKVIRTLRNETKVKVDNTTQAPVKTD
jgi:HlyD family secretion protein